MDLFPTFMEIAGARRRREDRASTASSLVPLLRRIRRAEPRRVVLALPALSALPTGGATPYSAIRKGDFKLIEFSTTSAWSFTTCATTSAKRTTWRPRCRRKSTNCATGCTPGGRKWGADADAEPELRSDEAGTHAAAGKEERSTTT